MRCRKADLLGEALGGQTMRCCFRRVPVWTSGHQTRSVKSACHKRLKDGAAALVENFCLALTVLKIYLADRRMCHQLQEVNLEL